MKYLYIFENHKDITGEWSFLRKEPKYIDFFKKLNDNDEVKEDERISIAKDYYEVIRKHRNTIKQNNMDIISLNSYEELTDVIQELELIEKFNKFTKLLPNHLRNEIKGSKEKQDKFKNSIIEFNYEEYKNVFLSKVSKYRNVNELLRAINNYLGSTNESIHILVDRIESTDGIRVFDIKDDILIAMVFSRKASCKFGSQQWCISGSTGNSWDSYVPDKMGVQYFIWDFNRDDTDAYSKIGISVYKNDKKEAFDKSDGSVLNLNNILGKDVVDSLLDISKISDDDLKSYLYYNLTSLMRRGHDSSDRIRFDRVIDDKLKKEIFSSDPTGYIKFFGNIDIINDDELMDLIDNDPLYISIKEINSRLPIEFLINFVIENPQYMKNIDKSHYVNISKSDFIKMLFNYTDFLDGESNVNMYNLLADIKQINPLYFTEPSFIKTLLKLNTDHTLRYFPDLLQVLTIKTVNKLYRDNEEEWDGCLDNYQGKNGYKTDTYLKHFKSYFSNKITMENFDTMDFFLFNASYQKIKIGVNSDNKKPQYEEVLTPEKFIIYNPLVVDGMIGMMKYRTMMQEGLRTYGIWVNKGLFDEESIDNMLSKKESWFLDLVDSRKIRV